jgi:hypothetical protein
MKQFNGIPNLNGRPKGAVNVSTAKVRESFSMLLENNLSTLESDLLLLKPGERLRILLELASFIIPKMKAVEVTNVENENYKPIIINLQSLSEWS